jgi:TonB-linked SusC/RagA family outer membrane protein
MRRLLQVCTVLWFGLAGLSAAAQSVAVSGKVTSGADGVALPGVSVIEKGTTNGTATDAGGGYRLNVSDKATLVFSFVGFVTQEVVVGNRTTIDVPLASDVQALGEVVVVGYGTQEKRDLTGSIASVKGEEIANIPVPSVEQSLQGRTAGVYISSGSGKLGQGIQVRVRGAASVSAGNQPLYVVDGIPITSSDIGGGVINAEQANPIADLNPNDIESIEILKDASAAAIYGSRASNGVVLITTKKGKAGRTNVDVGFYTGPSYTTRRREWLNGPEYVALFREAAENEGYVLEEELDFEMGEGNWDLNNNSNWADAAFQTGYATQYNVGISGGTEKTRFYLSGTHNDQKGIIVGNKFQRSSARINLEHSISSRLRVGANISLIRSVNNRVPDDNDFANPLQLNALPPIQAMYNADGQLNRRTIYYNNLIDLTDGFNIATTYRTISNVFGSFDIVPGLTFRSELGVDLLSLEEEVYKGRRTETGGPAGYGYNNQGRSFNYTLNNTLNFSRTFGDIHNLDVLAGIAYQEQTVESASTTGRSFPSDNYQKITSAAQIIGGSSSETGFSLVSYLARANYKLLDKYLFSVSARLDGSSRFGANNQYGFFPAASAGWILSEEAFLKESGFLNFLKLRVSYGLTGNSEVDNFASRGQYIAVPYAELAGITPNTVESRNLQWESTAQFDAAIDYGFFNNRLSGSFDYYVKNTNDLLLNVPLPSTNGYTTIPLNIGSLQNRGVEFTINTENLVGAFRWSTNFNIARNINKVTRLNVAPIEGGGRLIGRVAEGEPLGYFYTVKYAGVDPENGDALYFNENGEATNNYNAAPRQKVGDPNPDFIGGLTNTFSYKGFDLSGLLQFVYGNDVYNVAGYFQSANADYFDNQSKDQLRRWQKPGDITDVPQARLYAGNGTRVSSRWVQDGSFLRLKTVTLGYNLPKDLVNKVFLQSARIYVAGQNLLTFTDYDGYDPEVNSTYFQGTTAQQTNVNLGHDFYTPPLARTITFGVNLGF